MADERRADPDLREVIDRVAKSAATEGGKTGALEVLQGLGVNTNDPTEAQKDFAFLRANRQRCDAFYNGMFKNAIAAVTKLIIAIILLGTLALFGLNPEMLKGLFGL